MKKIFTLALSIIICNSMFAAAEFFVRINANGNYTVSLNNQTISTTANTFRFFDLNTGNYNLKVSENGYNGRVIYNQNILIQDGFRTVAELDAYNGLKIIDKLAFVQKSWYIDNIIPIQNTPVCGTTMPSYPIPNHPHCNIPPKHGNGYSCNQGGNYGYGNNNYPNNNYPANYPSYPNNYPNNGGNYSYNGGDLVNDNTLQSIIQAMKNATFEEKMIDIGKTALKDRILKTSQVHQLLALFSFETNKLAFAKICYDKTIDKNNYYTLYNDFAFSNYSSQLDKYINSK